MSLPIRDESHSTQIPSPGHHDEVSDIELDVFCDLSRAEIDAYSVVDIYGGVRIANGSPVVCYTEGNAFPAQLNTSYLCKLVLQEEHGSKYHQHYDYTVRTLKCRQQT